MNRRSILTIVVASLLVALFGIAPASGQEESLLYTVLDRGTLICGVNSTVPGFGYIDADTGEVTGFDTDFCRAIAAALFGDSTAVEFRPLTAQERFTALQTGEVDVLIRNTTWTLTRDTDVGMDFGPTTFYDGQGLMVRVADGFQSIEDLNGASICVLAGTTTELNITDAMESRGFEYELITFEQSADTMGAFVEERCDVLTSDRSQLAALRSNADNPALYTILPDVLSKEPLGPVYLQGDPIWADVVNWVTFGVMQAEEFGITSENIDEFLESDNPAIRRFLGLEGDLGSLLGLSNDFMVNVIRQVGNYAEIYDRNLGPDTPLAIDRGLNELWTNGGLLYPPAWR